MRKFQITQDFGEGSRGFVYFDMPETATQQEIEKEAIKVQKADYERRFTGFLGVKALERPTILIKEYKEGSVVRGGLKFKTKWR